MKKSLKGNFNSFIRKNSIAVNQVNVGSNFFCNIIPHQNNLNRFSLSHSCFDRNSRIIVDHVFRKFFSVNEYDFRIHLSSIISRSFVNFEVVMNTPFLALCPAKAPTNFCISRYQNKVWHQTDLLMHTIKYSYQAGNYFHSRLNLFWIFKPSSR